MIFSLKYFVLFFCVTFIVQCPYSYVLSVHTLLPWSMGRPMVWDATCVDTLAPSHIPSTSNCACAAASSAETLKRCKYVNLADGVKFRCDYSYSDIGWFKYHEIPATWADARLMCQLEGAILASPTTSDIKSAMQLSTGKRDIFTGIQAIFSRGHFFTNDGIPLAKFPHEWADSEPTNADNAARCVTLNCEGKLSNVRCDEPRPYVCYRKHSYVDTTICGTPDPEYHYDSRTNKCYKFHTTIRTFERAHFACSAEGGHLAIINSEQESKVLSELYTQNQQKVLSASKRASVFIGFHNWGEGGDWITMHGQTLKEAGFSKFHQGMPDNATTGEYCGSIMPNGQLNDLWCEDNYPFICEKSPEYPPVCDSEDENSSSNNIKLH